MTHAPHAMLLTTVLLSANAQARPTLHTLYSFGTHGPGTSPVGAIVQDSAGSLYGTTEAGLQPNDGTAYRLSPPTGGNKSWTYTALWNFIPHSPVGVDPRGGLTITPKGQIFGTTPYNNPNENAGCGSIFALRHKTGSWHAVPVWKFGHTQNDACYPLDAVTIGADGAFYGTTQSGGGFYGAIFRAVPPAKGQHAWTEQVLYAFTGQADGYYPETPLLADPSGAFFGTAILSANDPPAMAPLYELTPPAQGQSNWQFNLIWRFETSDCVEILGPLAENPTGVIYGACGDNLGNNGDSPGTIFRLTPPAQGSTVWTEDILWRFTGGADGGHPHGGVVIDKNGNLFGTTTDNNGTVFELSPPAQGSTNWTETTLGTFTGTNGSDPEGAVLLGPSGTIFGTTFYGGKNAVGTVFELTP